MLVKVGYLLSKRNEPRITKRQDIEHLKELQHYLLSSSNDETEKLKFVESWINDEQSAPMSFQSSIAIFLFQYST